jgi:WD40 repeat protein
VTRYSREGRLVVSGSADATARLWDANRASSIELKGHTRAVSSVAASASLISTASEDGTVKVRV